MHHHLLNALVPYDEVSNVHLLTLCLLDDSQLSMDKLSEKRRGPAQTDILKDLAWGENQE